MLTLENTIKHAENYMHLLFLQEQIKDIITCSVRIPTGTSVSVTFSSAVDDSTDGHDEVNTLRASIKEKDQRLSALEAKLDSFSHEQKDGGNKRKKTATQNEKEC